MELLDIVVVEIVERVALEDHHPLSFHSHYNCNRLFFKRGRSSLLLLCYLQAISLYSFVVVQFHMSISLLAPEKGS